jgi:hypothetical protein
MSRVISTFHHIAIQGHGITLLLNRLQRSLVMKLPHNSKLSDSQSNEIKTPVMNPSDHSCYLEKVPFPAIDLLQATCKDE